MDDAREEMRKLIDVIENGAKSTSVEQAVDDIKLFANTASFLANALDTRLKSKDAKPKKKVKTRKDCGATKTTNAIHLKDCKHTKASRHHNGHAQCNQHGDLTGRL
jgi:2-iminoacetate synthase ThiH